MKIISGGQTGVDRAALDVALSLSISCGGFCPKGRRAEDGPLDKKYPLTETASADYEIRTELNVKESSATLIFTRGKPTKGTAFTIALAKIHKKHFLIIDLKKMDSISAVKYMSDWIRNNQFEVLNVAGPRESNAPGIYEEVKNILWKQFAE